MDDEIKKETVEETTTETEEKETSETNESEEDTSSSQDDTVLDEALKEEDSKSKAKERFSQKKSGETSEEEDKPLTKKELTELIDRRVEQTRREMLEEQAAEYAKKISGSPKQAQLVLAVWRNRKLSGNLQQQINEAFAIASIKTIKAQKDEAIRALASKDTVEKGGETARRKTQTSEPIINPVDKKVLDGSVWDESKKAYRKTIAGGRKVFFVSKDFKKRWTEDAPKK